MRKNISARTDGLMIGELSKLTGVHIETIRYYERVKMLPKPPRTVGGRRVYDRAHVRRLGFIRRSRELGFSPDEIRALLRIGGRKKPRAAKFAPLRVLTSTTSEQKSKIFVSWSGYWQKRSLNVAALRRPNAPCSIFLMSINF